MEPQPEEARSVSGFWVEPIPEDSHVEPSPYPEDEGAWLAGHNAALDKLIEILEAELKVVQGYSSDRQHLGLEKALRIAGRMRKP